MVVLWFVLLSGSLKQLWPMHTALLQLMSACRSRTHRCKLTAPEVGQEHEMFIASSLLTEEILTIMYASLTALLLHCTQSNAVSETWNKVGTDAITMAPSQNEISTVLPFLVITQNV